MLITGVDIVEIPRIRRIIREYGDRFIYRIYTEEEIVFCRGRPAQFARRFAAKEAVMKALGTGTRGIRWRDIEIVRKKNVVPVVRLHSTARARAEQLGVKELALSLSDTDKYAVATVVGESKAGNFTPQDR